MADKGSVLIRIYPETKAKLDDIVKISVTVSRKLRAGLLIRASTKRKRRGERMAVKIIKDLPESEYHSQEGAKVPRLTYSIARELLFRSPLHAYSIHPLLGGGKKEASSAMNEGSVLHSLILGTDANIVVSPFDAYRTNEAKEFKQSVLDAGKIPVKQAEWDAMQESAEAIRKQIMAVEPEFYAPGNQYEVSVIWTDSNGVEWQSRFDCVNFETGYMADFKLTTDASQDKFERKILSMGYYIQETAYTACFEGAVPELAGREKWRFVVAENSSPYAVAVVDTDAGYEQLGMSQLDRASKIWKESLESGAWKGYGKYTAFAPPWAFKNEMMEE